MRVLFLLPRWTFESVRMLGPALRRSAWILLLTVSLVLGMAATPALAGLTDDHYDGEIFALYSGNGSLVPPRFSLEDALKRDRPTLLVFYVDDSSDSKQYTTVISQLQAYYGQAADFLPIRVDSIQPQARYSTNEVGYYYKGLVPQTVLLDARGKVILNETGILAFEQVDGAFRKVFDLLPRSQSAELKRRSLNEINTELVRE